LDGHWGEIAVDGAEGVFVAVGREANTGVLPLRFPQGQDDGVFYGIAESGGGLLGEGCSGFFACDSGEKCLAALVEAILLGEDFFVGLVRGRFGEDGDGGEVA
jgi:hypothetical protein